MAQADCLSGSCHMLAFAVHFRIYRNSCNTQSVGSLHDADSNFGAVGDKKFLNHSW